ncbi:MAG: hypothetical protein HQL12_04715 [Candidatus Omnitrophica bacterium]|nr:hypothetical protein [Candidatus Omnitrophota bacterium]
MGKVKNWMMELEEQERARLEEQCIREKEIIEIREKIENLLSRLDYDSLIQAEKNIKYEKSTRPEERYY